jgi:hypothetical protein
MISGWNQLFLNLYETTINSKENVAYANIENFAVDVVRVLMRLLVIIWLKNPYVHISPEHINQE